MSIDQRPLFIFLSVFALCVSVADAATTTYGPGTYFTLAPDGESYDGTAIPVGGTNLTPISATLTGIFSPTSVTTAGGSPTLLPGFSVTVSDTPTLMDGDTAVINGTNGTDTYPIAVFSWDLIFPGNAGEFDILNLSGPNSLPPDFPVLTEVQLTDLTLTVTYSGVPEPSTWVLLIVGLGLFVMVRRSKLAGGVFRSLFNTEVGGVRNALLAVFCLISAHGAIAQVQLTTETVPSSGVAGITSVSVIGEGFPSGTITASNIVVTLATTCDGTPAATSTATIVRKILGSTERVNFPIPGGITSGTYYVTLADSTAGDSDFTTKTGSCSAVQVKASVAILNSCVAGSSLGVLLPPGGTDNVTAYVPRAWWGSSVTGIVVDNIEGTLGAAVEVPTAHPVNSCSANPTTGQTVCVANNTDVYLLTGTALTNTLTSGSNNLAGFSGGYCNNCGVAVNAANNTAVINMGITGAASGDGVQVLNLNNNTFQPAFPMKYEVSENISVDPTRSLILSANEDGFYVIDQIQTDGSLKEFDPTFNSGINDDSSAEDCSTGIAIGPGEFSASSLQMVNLNAITFGATTYTAPQTDVALTTNYSFSAGPCGSAVAQGSGHLAVLTGEFGGNTFAVLKLPATPGTGVPSLVDYVVAAIPANAACGGTFQAGYDPHTVTAYTSPNTGDSYGVFAGYIGGVPACLAVVDMTTLITSATRGGAGYQAHDISRANFPPSAVKFFSLAP